MRPARASTSPRRRASSTVWQTITPLPAASPDALTTTGAPNSSIARIASASDWQVNARAVGTPASTMSSFRKCLRRLEHRAGARRAEDRQAGAAKRVDDAGGERRLGSDQRPVDALLPRERHASRSMSVAPIGTHVANSAMPGLPGAAKISMRRIILSQAPGERVLAPASAHEQHLHRLRHAELTASLALLKPSLNVSTVSRVFWP